MSLSVTCSLLIQSLLSHKEGHILSSAAKWIELKDVMLSEISQIRKGRMLSLLHGN